LINATLAASGKVEISTVNKLLNEYNNTIFGKATTKQSISEKDTLQEKMKGFRALFTNKQVKFKPVVGEKIKAEFKNIGLKELLNMEKK